MNPVSRNSKLTNVNTNANAASSNTTSNYQSRATNAHSNGNQEDASQMSNTTKGSLHTMVAAPSQWINDSCLNPLSHAFLASSHWRILLVIGNFILLFGNPFQMLFLPAAADVAMDVIYTCVLIAFIVDMIFRSVAVPGYFGISVTRMNLYQFLPRSSGESFKDGGSGGSTGDSITVGNNNVSTNNASPAGSTKKSSTSHHRHHHHHSDNSGGSKMSRRLAACFGWCRCVSFGSFLFWCDLFSTFTLLYDISYTNPKNFEMVQWPLTLEGDGRPSYNSMEMINMASPWEINGGLMITVLKTARIVRFVRSQAVSTLISRVNWYWPLQRMNACMAYFDCCFPRRAYYHDEDHSDGDTPNNSALGGTRPNQAGGGGPNGIGGGRGDGGRGDPMGTSSKGSNVAPGVEEYQARRASLRRLAENGGPDGVDDATAKGFFGVIVYLLRTVGIMSQDETAFKRDMAATKIQRAWRRAMYRQIQQSDDQFRDELGVLDEMAATEDGPSRKVGVKKNQGPNKKRLPNSLRKMSVYPGHATTAISARISQKLKYAAGGDHAAESQVGGAMRELTGQRVAIGILVALLLTATFTYVEQDATRPATMIILHAQTTGTSFSQDGTFVTQPPPERWKNLALGAARATSIPDLYQFDIANGKSVEFVVAEEKDNDLRPRERLQITVQSTNFTSPTNSKMKSVGWFAYRTEQRNQALVQLYSTVFILFLWLFGVTAFAGPVMVLVVLPIERMVRLLGMLMVDPLGYQSTSRYRRFVAEEDELTKNTRWTKEVLKGMETSFLMSTILRIGSLMKVGFGSAGVEIIRKSLEKKQGGTVNLLTSKGITVSCIFLFCDIRQFTDATECLQEEVFVFTNRIAAVVHSFCHSYGGSANKNVGDAFLCSWLLDAPPNDGSLGVEDQLFAKNSQADKCLLCVVKIIMALHHDSYYIETMSEAPRQRLLAKLKKRPGPVVQMGCGLHAGKAVQGAIGSERKIDATYVSEAVEMSEFLESSTKKYGLKMLCSNAFHTLLHPNNRQRCRLVDQIVLPNDDDDEDDDMAIMYDRDDLFELYTYDMDVDALWTAPPSTSKSATDRNSLDTGSMSDADSRQGQSDRRGELKKGASSNRVPGSTRMGRTGRRMSISGMLQSKSAMTSSSTSGPGGKGPLDGSAHDFGGAEHGSAVMKSSVAGGSSVDPKEDTGFRKPELILPTGPILYNPTVWRTEQMFRIRKKYLDGLFFHNYSQGLQSFYHRDWDRATQSFKSILATFEDGPSRYFLTQIELNEGKPPPNFRPYGTP